MLTGTGMAFPWPIIQQAPLASGNIVEDMQMGIDLTVEGHAPRLCSQALVLGELPVAGAAAVKQRTRWEHGHMQTLLTQAPRLALASLRKLRPDLFGLALELSVPPLSMLMMLWAAGLACTLVGWALGGLPCPSIVLVIGGLMVPVSILAAWFKFGREKLPLSALLSTPFYVLWKIPIYLSFLVRREKKWVRTERTGEGEGKNSTPES